LATEAAEREVRRPTEKPGAARAALDLLARRLYAEGAPLPCEPPESWRCPHLVWRPAFPGTDACGNPEYEKGGGSDERGLPGHECFTRWAMAKSESGEGEAPLTSES
jgi:hypothetical protein